MKRLEYLIKHNRFVQFLYRIFFSAIFSILSFFTPIKKNLVLISSFSGKKYNDSPKVIYDSMQQDGLLEKYDVVWAFENPELFAKENIKTVKINSFKYFKIAFKAKYWITNVNIERGLKFKKKKQIYLNTWHGTGPKTCGNAASGRKDYNFKNVNYICSDGEYLKAILIRDLKAKPENVIMCGRPREDLLYNPDISKIEKMRARYKISKNDFVILYAPTWREPKNKSTISSLDLVLDIERILKEIPNSKVLFRAHSITNEVKTNLEFGERFISVTDEPDIGDLFLITSVLITDYSSSVTDISILGKPFICFAPDYEDYLKERSLYYDIQEEFPFGVQKSTEDVISVLKQILNGNDKKDCFAAFKMKYAPYGGQATKTCLRILFQNK